MCDEVAVKGHENCSQICVVVIMLCIVATGICFKVSIKLVGKSCLAKSKSLVIVQTYV